MRVELQEELGHAGALIQRIMFLGGDPKIEVAKTPTHATSLATMFEADLADEKGAVVFYTAAAEAAVEDSDIGTRALFERILLDAEGHIAWLDLRHDLRERMVEFAYTARHMTAPSDALPALPANDRRAVSDDPIALAATGGRLGRKEKRGTAEASHASSIRNQPVASGAIGSIR
jgi:bacterioferritin